MTTYDYRFINRQVFSGSVYYTLLIDVVENSRVVQSFRIDKTFKVSAEQVDSEFLRLAASVEIEKLQNLAEEVDGNIN